MTVTPDGANIRESSPQDGALLASLAILSVNWTEAHASYLDNFIPFVVDALRRTGLDEATNAQAATALMDIFGLAIPPAVIHDILKRAARRGFGRFDGPLFRRQTARAKTPPTDIEDQQRQSIREQAALVEKLRAFAKTAHDLSWDTTHAEQKLEDFVERMGAPTLRSAMRLGGQHSDPGSGGTDFVVADFVRLLDREDPVGFGWLESMIKGSMLASALYLPSSVDMTRRFRRTTLWLDTPVLLGWLGFEGPEAEQSIESLLSLARNQGAEIAVFLHTVRETRGVLLGVARNLGALDATVRPGGVLEWFRGQGATSADLMSLASGLEEQILRRDVVIREAPDHGERFAVDETSLESKLQSRVQYTRQEAMRCDLQSLTAIHRLRHGATSDRLEDCRHLLVTNNDNLVRVAAEFFDEYRGVWPVAALDHEIASLLWLKTPTVAPDVPRRQIIADALAALQPSRELWGKYLAEMERRQVRGTVSQADLAHLRYAPEMVRAVMEITQGQAANFGSHTVDAALLHLRSEGAAPIRAELEETSEALRRTEQSVRELEARLATVTERVSGIRTRALQRADRMATRVEFVIRVLMVLFVAAMLLSFLPLDGLAGNAFGQLAVWGIRVCGGLGVIAGTLSLLRGDHLFGLAAAVSGRLRRTLQRQALTSLGIAEAAEPVGGLDASERPR